MEVQEAIAFIYPRWALGSNITKMYEGNYFPHTIITFCTPSIFKIIIILL